ncbi:HD-GYP domain-containing protein [Methylobacterium sp. E-045]|uniref:HD-GYP domain-containing protein n=1 Tax=Methylobacterium sp. E-045 TaxID=2836575 RepID=UPI001FBA19A4|nr:HD domain-containing phosphohydrolase [Methylobacterium sp. E-045]MCJ2131436.1 HD domain-containing protein [Methylobacterium sp. E-045]
MKELMLISDDFRRTERLLHDLRLSLPTTIYDLYDHIPPANPPVIVLSDIRELTSDAVARLKHLLSQAGIGKKPHVFVVYNEGPRTQAYAQMLGVTTMINAAAFSTLPRVIERVVVEAGMVPLSVKKHASRAREFLRDTIMAGVLTPTEVANGTEIVATAISTHGIYDWIRVVRDFDDGTHQHILLVAGLAAAFAGTLGMSITDRHRLAQAALLHDVGKIKIPVAILNKPGRLDASEMTVMRTHAIEGYRMLIGLGFDDAMLGVVRSHHEMLDGSGYPDGLSGNSIPDFVRLITVCDVYGALIEERPYREPMAATEAYSILVGMMGRLDADLVHAFRPVVIASAMHANRFGSPVSSH